jgi:hypothetical protein
MTETQRQLILGLGFIIIPILSWTIILFMYGLQKDMIHIIFVSCGFGIFFGFLLITDEHNSLEVNK